MEVNNFTRFMVDEKALRKIAERVLAEEKKDCTELSVSIVGPEGIKRLNKKYRKIGKPTDVLSFTYNDAGEIILCPQVIKENAKKYGEDFKKELNRVFIHGILHILGYDHEKGGKEEEKMTEKQEYYLNKLA